MKSFFVVVNCFFMYIFQFKILIDNIEVWIKTPDCYFFEVTCRRSGNRGRDYLDCRHRPNMIAMNNLCPARIFQEIDA